MRRHGPPTRFLLLTAIVFATILIGCDNTVEPFSQSSRYFALFGYLDADRDTQFVRIEPTRSNPDVGPVTFDVVSVRTTDLNSGKVTFWSDSLVTLDDGTIGFLSYAIFRPVRGDAYRFEVSRSDGVSTTATTRVPVVPVFSVKAPSHLSSGALEQGLLFDGVQRSPAQMTVSYFVTYGAVTKPVEVRVRYTFLGAPEGQGWRVIVRLTRDTSTVFERLGLTGHDEVALHGISIELRLLSNDWPVDDPGLAATNVSNGFGFVGSAVTNTATWTLDSASVADLGLIDGQGD